MILCLQGSRYTAAMRQTLKSGDWLNDEHIHFAQELLRRDYPDIAGFQPTLLSQVDRFTPIECRCESLLIHHINANHWMVSTTIGGEVTIADSKCSSDFSSCLTHQLAQVYRKYIDNQVDDGRETYLPVRVLRVQQQSGGSDCGLFAIAFAVHLLQGNNIEEIEFDQKKMRSHLNYCFWKKKLFAFPTLSKKGYRKTTQLPYFHLDIYCSCKMPETYGDMVECVDCEEWYHKRCIEGINNDFSGNWICKYCMENGNNS